MHSDLVRATDSGLVTGLVLLVLALSSAFDTVDHPILLSTVTHRRAVRDTALAWFQSYLDHRSQSFCVAGHQTVDFILDCSVPEGSVLGPLLFISYAAEVSEVFDDRHDDHFMTLLFLLLLSIFIKPEYFSKAVPG